MEVPTFGALLYLHREQRERCITWEGRGGGGGGGEVSTYFCAALAVDPAPHPSRPEGLLLRPSGGRERRRFFPKAIATRLLHNLLRIKNGYGIYH